jgi:hypothetical protein
VSFETSALILTWVAIAMLALAMAGLLRQIRTLAATVAPGITQLGPTIGLPAPQLNGREARWPNSAILVFLDAGCQTCEQLIPRLTALSDIHGGQLTFVAVFRGDAVLPVGSSLEILANQQSAFDSFRVPVTPFGVAVASSGLIVAARPIGSAKALEELVEGVRERSLENVS